MSQPNFLIRNSLSLVQNASGTTAPCSFTIRYLFNSLEVTGLSHRVLPTFIMASDGPDPQSLKSWQDAFQYPVPTVRRVEQELRRDIASNKEKLRALVG
jgi:hypothetical protein